MPSTSISLLKFITICLSFSAVSEKKEGEAISYEIHCAHGIKLAFSQRCKGHPCDSHSSAGWRILTGTWTHCAARSPQTWWAGLDRVWVTCTSLCTLPAQTCSGGGRLAKKPNVQDQKNIFKNNVKKIRIRHLLPKYYWYSWDGDLLTLLMMIIKMYILYMFHVHNSYILFSTARVRTSSLSKEGINSLNYRLEKVGRSPKYFPTFPLFEF